MNVLIADVGGKNATFVTRVLIGYATESALDCKINEMRTAEENGSIVTHVRFGEKVFSPTVREGGAGAIISFDILEAARVKHYLGEKGILLVNDTKIESTFANGAAYPDGLKTSMLEEINGVYFIEGDRLAQGGDALPAVMLGAFTRLLKLDREIMLEVIKRTSDNVDKAARAFGQGYSFLK